MKGQPVVIKIGGSVLDQLHPDFFQECVQLRQKGCHPVIVHGGGPLINRLQKRLGMEPVFREGLRVTDDDDLELVEMVLAGRINKHLVTRLEQAGGEAVGVSGVDRNLIQVRKKSPALGWVGEVERVNLSFLQALIRQGWIPVVASIGVDRHGQHYNINADTVAGAVAQGLQAEKMFLVTDVPGIRTDTQKAGTVLSHVSVAQVENMVKTGAIHGGMIPKVMAAVSGLRASVREVVILDGRSPGSLSLYPKKEGPGTRIGLKEEEGYDTVSYLST